MDQPKQPSILESMTNARDYWYGRAIALEHELETLKKPHAEPYKEGYMLLLADHTSLQARITELEARLAQTWQPLPDGEYDCRHDSCKITVAGEWLHAYDKIYSVSVEVALIDNIRLCRLVERAESQPQPDWSSAPEWAQWWSVDADGEATFWQNKPDVICIRGMWYDDGECLVACDLDLPIGIDWRTTLRQRPTEDSHE